MKFTLMFKSCFFLYFSNMEITGNKHCVYFSFCSLFFLTLTCSLALWCYQTETIEEQASRLILEDKAELPCSLQMRASPCTSADKLLYAGELPLFQNHRNVLLGGTGLLQLGMPSRRTEVLSSSRQLIQNITSREITCTCYWCTLQQK